MQEAQQPVALGLNQSADSDDSAPKIVRCAGQRLGCLGRGNKKCANQYCGPCCRDLQRESGGAVTCGDHNPKRDAAKSAARSSRRTSGATSTRGPGGGGDIMIEEDETERERRQKKRIRRPWQNSDGAASLDIQGSDGHFTREDGPGEVENDDHYYESGGGRTLRKRLVRVLPPRAAKPTPGVQGPEQIGAKHYYAGAYYSDSHDEDEVAGESPTKRPRRLGVKAEPEEAIAHETDDSEGEEEDETAGSRWVRGLGPGAAAGGERRPGLLEVEVVSTPAASVLPFLEGGAAHDGLLPAQEEEEAPRGVDVGEGGGRTERGAEDLELLERKDLVRLVGSLRDEVRELRDRQRDTERKLNALLDGARGWAATFLQRMD